MWPQLFVSWFAVSPGFAAPRTLWDIGKPQGHVDVLETLPSAEDFSAQYMVVDRGFGKPVLFKGAAKLMPAWEKWQTDKSIRNLYGKVRMDQVETEKRETRKKYPHENWSMAKFLDYYNTSDIYSTAATPKAMKNDVMLLPPFTCGGYTNKLAATVLWFSSGNTSSVVHKDGQNNQHCMFAGRKEWILWHPKDPIDKDTLGWTNAEVERHKDPAFKDTYGTFAGRINVKDMDQTVRDYPDWDKLRWWKMTLEAGDCAYIPPSWYHFVESPAVRTISVHVWFGSDRGFNSKSCEALRAKGIDLSTPLFRLSDCTFGFGEDKQRTKCKLPKARNVEL